MNNKYFRNISNIQTGYLTETPKKASVIDNAAIAGNAVILGGSNNRALIISTPDAIYLQSYDTLILKYDRKTGAIVKLWNNYTVTTLKHINAFMRSLNGKQFNKSEWIAFKGVLA